jgi:hypothetical protein
VGLSLALAFVSASAQQPRAPRTPWGHPDLQGIWNNSTTTPLERPVDLGTKAFLTEAEAAARDREVSALRSTDQEPRAGDPGTYNELWWERGRTAVNRQTSIIVDPPNGRMPAFTPGGRRLVDGILAKRQGRGPADSYEDRPLQERCIIYRGVPPIPAGYNNNYRIVQTPNHVAMLYEMIHEVRIIPLDGRPHLAPSLRQWMGDSRGRFEGDTLVVETKNFDPRLAENYFTRMIGVFATSGDMRVVERFRRADANTIDYTFTITDPDTLTAPVTGSLPMMKDRGPIFEYACHEGNYALANVLAGARREEKRR